jgi:AraC family transcriptional regulator, transcriptional activator of pobA
MQEIKNIKCSDVTQNELRFAVYHTADFLPFMQKLSVPHKHNYYMILLNKNGIGKQLIDFKEAIIEPLSITCMHYGQVHQWLDYDALDGYILVFENDFFALRYQDYQLSEFSFLTYRQQQPYLKVSPQQFAHWQNLLQWMLAEFKDKPNNFDKSLRSLLNLLLIDINRIFEPAKKTEEQSQSFQLVHHYEELIDKHFKEKHFVKDYATLLYVRPNYLNAVCNDVTSFSAGDLIRNRILLEAKRMLIHENKTVAEIAFHLGFEDNSYFGRFFKKYENITPDGFKKQYLKTE